MTSINPKRAYVVTVRSFDKGGNFHQEYIEGVFRTAKEARLFLEEHGYYPWNYNRGERERIYLYHRRTKNFSNSAFINAPYMRNYEPYVHISVKDWSTGDVNRVKLNFSQWCKDSTDDIKQCRLF